MLKLPYWPREAPSAMPRSESNVTGRGKVRAAERSPQRNFGTNPPTKTRSLCQEPKPVQTVMNAASETATRWESYSLYDAYFMVGRILPTFAGPPPALA